uniref:Uncharacterized protein n=1 Tax=Arundo donax TaxID=35708 RepID=A0A0A9FXF8_ARUDO
MISHLGIQHFSPKSQQLWKIKHTDKHKEKNLDIRTGYCSCKQFGKHLTVIFTAPKMNNELQAPCNAITNGHQEVAGHVATHNAPRKALHDGQSCPRWSCR